MKLSNNFSLHEFTRSQLATRLRIDNTPDWKVVKKLKTLTINILQKVRNHYKHFVTINSGYRSPLLNRRLGGSPRSQHCKGEAADFEITGLNNYDVAKWIEDHLNFDQLILEFYDEDEDNPNSGWIHVSYKNKKENRQQVLRAKKENGKVSYHPGLVGFFV